MPLRISTKSIVWVWLILFISLSLSAAEKKPNFLFIAIDDMNDWTGFLGGHPEAKTPNMDKLASLGVNFSNAHCSAPGCSPSRNSLLFGIEPFKSGLYQFYEHKKLPVELMKSYTPVTEFLKDNGYNTYGSGKIHHRRNATASEWTEFFPKGKASLEFDAKDGYRHGNSTKSNFSPTLNPLRDHIDYKNTTFGVEVLKRKHDKPFFLGVGIIKPHLPFVAPKQFFDLYPKEVEAPKIKEGDLDDVPAVGRSMAKIPDDIKFTKDKAWTKVRRAYLACNSWADHNVGRLLDALKKSAYTDNTIVILWSDHGYGMGEKRHFRKFALWEITTRVPFIIWDTRDKAAPMGRKVDDGVSLINIYRTMAEFADLQPPKYVDGFSLVPQMKDPANPLPGPAICTWGRGNYTIRNKHWRYTRYYDGTEELYSHETDPEEWNNLAANPEFTDIRKQLRAQLPEKGAPLVKKGMERCCRPVSADKPIRSGKKKAE